jgi:hypothetical protein
MVDSDGNIAPGFQGGMRLSVVESDQFIKGLVETNSGYFIIWKDSRSGSSDIYGQMIDFNGTIIGDSDGIPIVTAANDQQAPSITYNSQSNEVMVCWEDFRNGLDFNIYCAAIDASTLEINSDIGICTYNGNQKSPDVYATQDGTYLFTWEDSRNSVTSNIYYQSMANNTFDYTNDGVVLCDADFNQFGPTIDIYDETNNSYMIYWDDMRSSGKEDLSNIYIQSVTIEPSEGCTTLDVNNDGLINVIDVVQTVNLVLGDTPPTELEACAADGNMDGIINVLDVVLLVNYILS